MIRRYYSLKQKIIEHLYCDKGSYRIYMFHFVENSKKRHINNNNLTINLDEFKSFIYSKIENNWEYTSIDNIGQVKNKQQCTITFDDMCKNAFYNAVPILCELNIPFMCFISPYFIGKSEYIDYSELEILKNINLCKIGAHGVNHSIVRYLNYQEKLREVSKSKHEELLCCSIDSFAFPYGSLYACDYQTRKIVEKEYKYSFSTISRAINISRNFESTHFLPRININSNNYMIK